MPPAQRSIPSANAEAAQWLARRDRGLSSAEAEAFAQWLKEDPARGPQIARLESVWSQLDRLQTCCPGGSSDPDPDLLVAARPRRWAAWSLGLAAAAVVAIGALVWRNAIPAKPAEAWAQASAPTQTTLEDGSLVELNVGAKIATHFSREQRAVQLLAGEAHFVVTKDPSRPFVVSTREFAVRAVGTAFAVKNDGEGISVMVTEGKVSLDQLRSGGASAAERRELSSLHAGQIATVLRAERAGVAPNVEVKSVTPAEMESALAWQTMRLEFVATPLRDVVAKFNRYNSRKLTVADEATGEILVGGAFRADNIDAFVRLTEIGFGLCAQDNGAEIVLSRR